MIALAVTLQVAAAGPHEIVPLRPGYVVGQMLDATEELCRVTMAGLPAGDVQAYSRAYDGCRASLHQTLEREVSQLLEAGRCDDAVKLALRGESVEIAASAKVVCSPPPGR